MTKMTANFNQKEFGMSWNYRILDYGTHLALHEVYYDTKGSISSYTEEPTRFVADPLDGPMDIISGLSMAIRDAVKHPVIKVVGDDLIEIPIDPQWSPATPQSSGDA